MRSLLPWLCLFALLVVAPFGRAQSRIFHCIGAHGEPVFSGQPCGNPVAPPMVVGASNAGGSGYAGTFAHGLGGACSASPEALRQSIAAAFAARDVNRLAGLILWRGVGQSSARETLRSLAAWLKQPLVGIASASDDAPSWVDENAVPVASSPADAPPPALAPQPPAAFEVSTGGPEGRTREFGIAESGGCWWLTL